MSIDVRKGLRKIEENSHEEECVKIFYYIIKLKNKERSDLIAELKNKYVLDALYEVLRVAVNKRPFLRELKTFISFIDEVC